MNTSPPPLNEVINLQKRIFQAETDAYESLDALNLVREEHVRDFQDIWVNHTWTKWMLYGCLGVMMGLQGMGWVTSSTAFEDVSCICSVAMMCGLCVVWIHTHRRFKAFRDRETYREKRRSTIFSEHRAMYESLGRKLRHTLHTHPECVAHLNAWLEEGLSSRTRHQWHTLEDKDLIIGMTCHESMLLDALKRLSASR